MVTTLARPKRAEPEKYGETKNRYSVMLTSTASEQLDEVADKLGITRSEVLEQMIRNGGLDLVQKAPKTLVARENLTMVNKSESISVMPHSDREKQKSAVRASMRKKRGYQRGDRTFVFTPESLNRLTEQERQILEWFYRDKITLQQIGDRLGFSRQMAGKIKQRALAKIQSV